MRKVVAAAALGCAFLFLASGPGQLRAEEAKEHKVIKGDTLWDLSQSYLHNPLLWPKIWKLNPQIKNPHEISPGEVVKIPTLAEKPEQETSPEGGGMELAKPVAPPEAPPAEPPAVAPEPEPPPAPKTTIDLTKEPPPLRVVKKREIPEAEPEKAINLSVARLYDRGIGIVTFDIPQDGKVLYTTEGWRFSAKNLQVKIDAPGAKVGQQFGIYRDLGVVRHPDHKKKSPGHLLADIGILQVDSIDHGQAMATVTRAFAEVEAGDLLGPVPPMPVIKRHQARGGGQDVSGRVVALHLNRSIAGADDIVYIDLGKNDGLEAGDTLQVKNVNDKGKHSDNEILILRVTPMTAAAVVTNRSKHAVFPGDIVGPAL